MLRKRPHDVIERLTDEHHIAALLDQLPKLLHAGGPKLRFQNVFKIFFAQQIQAIAGDSGQQRVHHARGKSAIDDVKERPKHAQ